MDLQKQLQEIIEKNMPKAVGDALQKRLKQADRLEEDLRVANIRGESVDKTNRLLEKKIEKYKENDERNTELNNREKAVYIKESKIELSDIKNQLEVAKDKTDFCKAVALGLVRNTVYRNNLYHSQSASGAPTFDAQGGAHYPTAEITEHKESKEAE